MKTNNDSYSFRVSVTLNEMKEISNEFEDEDTAMAILLSRKHGIKFTYVDISLDGRIYEIKVRDEKEKTFFLLKTGYKIYESVKN